MHELGITQGIIDRARETAVANGARMVTDLYLTMTPAADFAFDSIEMYFEMLSADEPMFAGATLHFEHGRAGAACLQCGDEFLADTPQPICTVCGSQEVRFDPRAPMIRLTDIGVDDAAGESGEG